eukprot:gene27003-biopygen17573
MSRGCSRPEWRRKRSRRSRTKRRIGMMLGKQTGRDIS